MSATADLCTQQIFRVRQTKEDIIYMAVVERGSRDLCETYDAVKDHLIELLKFGFAHVARYIHRFYLDGADYDAIETQINEEDDYTKILMHVQGISFTRVPI
eukprot:798186_1